MEAIVEAAEADDLPDHVGPLWPAKRAGGFVRPIYGVAAAAGVAVVARLAVVLMKFMKFSNTVATR